MSNFGLKLKDDDRERLEKIVDSVALKVQSRISNHLLYRPGERLAAMGPGLGRKTDEAK